MTEILTEIEAEAFLEKQGFPVVERYLIHNEEDAEKIAAKWNTPVVLKITGKELIHKSELNGVRVKITKEEIKKNIEELQKINVKKDGLVVQKYIEGEYMIIGLKKDPTFGMTVTAGLGGIFTEVMQDISLRVLPIVKRDAEQMLKELRGYILFQGYRGKKLNEKAVIEIILKVAKLGEKFQSIKELDLNPVVVNEKQAIIVDARIVLE
ncbi:acetate--CoA ligase family protein [Candidatus Woesearchaeota archaeon]|nr:acetate--CoA ligase family protein [Candidatus Woesearchaeota archaeon]